jgi:PAS domain S-box-containing protein
VHSIKEIVMASNPAAAQLGLAHERRVGDEDRQFSIASEPPPCERAPQGHLLTDREGVVTEASSSAMNLLGLGPGMLIGRALSDALPAPGQATFKAELRRLARDGRTERWNVLLARKNDATIVARFTVQVIAGTHHSQNMLLWFIDENAVNWCTPSGAGCA